MDLYADSNGLDCVGADSVLKRSSNDFWVKYSQNKSIRTMACDMSDISEFIL